MGITTSRVTRAAFVVSVYAFLLALPAFGQQDIAASVAIRFADRTSNFHVGEVILALYFSAVNGWKSRIGRSNDALTGPTLCTRT